MLKSEDPTSREWAAVALFYSAYNRVRAAMLSDPIWGDLKALAAISPKLALEDQNATHHQGRKSGTGHRLGVSEIVPLLYPTVKGQYWALHSASIDVRYGSKLIAPLADLERRADEIHQAAAEGHLVAGSA